MGKAFEDRKKKEDRPEGDFYSTPKSLIWVAKDIIKREFTSLKVLEPCHGKGAISEELTKMGFNVVTNDLYYSAMVNVDYLKVCILNDYIITNPPFSLWDDFVNKAKFPCKKFMFIGRMNYLGTQSRLKNGIWNNLKAIYPFSRYIDYRTPYRQDGLFHVGSQATGWFLWDMEYEGLPTIEVLDVSNYATLGAFIDLTKEEKEFLIEWNDKDNELLYDDFYATATDDMYLSFLYEHKFCNRVFKPSSEYKGTLNEDVTYEYLVLNKKGQRYANTFRGEIL
jgi:hypothetical protein